MKKTTLLSLGLIAASSPLVAQSLIFHEDFNTSSDGSLAAANWKNVQHWGRPADSEDSLAITTENSANYFEQAGNGYFRLQHKSGTGSLFVESQAFSAPSMAVSVAFDFYAPAQTSWGTPNDSNPFPSIVVGRAGAFGSGLHRVPHQLTFAEQNGGVSGTANLFEHDTLHSLVFVYNNSLETVNYLDGSGFTVAPSSYDVWLDGERVIIGGGGSVVRAETYIQEGDPLTTIGIGSFSQDGEIFIDNLSIRAGAVIPEPSTYALGFGLVALAVTTACRRRKA